jgi:hypothetical protein
LWWGDHCNLSKKHNSNHLAIHEWIRSSIHHSQQPTSPIGFLFLKLPHMYVLGWGYDCSPLTKLCWPADYIASCAKFGQGKSTEEFMLCRHKGVINFLSGSPWKIYRSKTKPRLGDGYLAFQKWHSFVTSATGVHSRYFHSCMASQSQNCNSRGPSHGQA